MAPSMNTHSAFSTHTHMHKQKWPPTPWGLTSVALWRIVCLRLRLNNFTGAVPPLLLCLIIPCTLSALSRGRKRDRMDIKQHLWGMEEGVKVGVCVCV